MSLKTNTEPSGTQHKPNNYLIARRPAQPFPSRLRSHMDTYGWSRVSPVGNEKEYWDDIHRNGSAEKNRRTAYIHIPFCGTLCTFCNFQRKPGTAAMAADYAQWVLKELKWYAQSAYVAQGGFEALYFGGGTPSLLPSEAMVELVTAARQTLGLADTAEITVESTIHDLNEEKLQAMVQAGVTRISLGVQTFDTTMRRQLGRISSKSTIAGTIAAARQAGIQTISADILYRLPGQTVEAFADDLACAVELNLDGVSMYPLIAMPGTPLEKGLERQSIAALPDLQIEMNQCRMAHQYLADSGYRQDTCTHFVKSKDKNLYANIRLDDGDCLPIGCSAGGYLGPLVLMNAMNRQMYQGQISADKPGYMGSLMLPAKSRLLRSVTGQLQRGFLNPKTVWQDGSIDVESIIADKLKSFQEKGLLAPSDDHYKLAREGWCWSYNIAADFANIASQKDAGADMMGDFSGAVKPQTHPHAVKYASRGKRSGMYGFTIKDLSVLGVMCALVVVVQFVAAMLLHLVGVAVIPGVMQFVMAFASCIVMFVALRKVPKAGALSIMSAVYSMVTMLMSGSILMGFGLVIGGVLGDVTAKQIGGIHKTAPLIIALMIYRVSQTTFSKLYAFITDMTQVQLVWYLIVLSIIMSAIGAVAGGFAGMKLSRKITKAGVMA